MQDKDLVADISHSRGVSFDDAGCVLPWQHLEL